MTPLLAPDEPALASQLARKRALLAFDFDGTLAPIRRDRDAVRMRSRTAALLARVCRLYPCAVISGRGRADVAGRLEGADVRYVVGNHGLEPGVDLAAHAALVTRVRPRLVAALTDEVGVDIEDKAYSLAVHYRASPRPRAAEARIRGAVAALSEPLRIVAGKRVLNVVPAGGASKGDALLALREREQAEVALYVGDDVTDEDVFTLDQPGRLLSVRVGPSTTSAARYFLADQREIDTLLARLAALRETTDPP